MTSSLEDLHAAAADARLPDAIRAQAGEIALRLDTGVRIVVMGPSASGKSTLCHAIAGRKASTDGKVIPRIFARERRGPAFSIADELEWIETHTGLMRHAQLIDIGSGDHLGEPASLVQACLEIADIVLWCTQRFDEREAALWRDAPDALKDHSFLVLTMADALARTSALHEQINALDAQIGDDFRDLIAVSALPIVSLSDAGFKISDAQLATSGIKHLLSVVSRMVEEGRRADHDHALLFLERHGRAPVAEPVATPHQSRPDVQSVECPHLESQAAKRFGLARQKMSDHTLDLAELAFDQTESDMSGVLARCGTIADDLVAVFHDSSDLDEQTRLWVSEFENAADKITLMSLENDTRSAADAVTILLQIKRDLDHLTLQ